MAGIVKDFVENHKSIVNVFNKFSEKHPFLSTGLDYSSGGAMFLGLNTLAITMNAPVLTTIAAVVLLTTLATGGLLPGFATKHTIAGSIAAGKTAKAKLISKKDKSPVH